MFVVLQNIRNTLNKSRYLINIRNCTKSVTGDRIKPLTETLTGRLLLYLKNKSPKTDLKVNTNSFKLINLIKETPQNIKKLDISQIILALNVLGKKEIVNNQHEFFNILQIIDAECCQRIKQSDSTDKINLLQGFIDLIPHRVSESDYFHMAVEDLTNHRSSLNKDELIQLIFYIGFLKKSFIAQKLIRKCIKLFSEETINKLTQEDICIICNSTFKTSTKIKNNLLLNKIKLYLADNLCILKDPAIFITIIKSIRHNRSQDEDIISTITCTMFFNKTIDSYSFSAMCHILALYSDYLYYDEKVLEVFSKRCLEVLKSKPYIQKRAYFEDQPRSKDIKRFLWALSNLNYKLSKNDIHTIIMPQILQRINAKEFIKDPGMLIDMLLYLWMMQYKAINLIKEHLNQENVNTIRRQNSSSEHSLNLLLTCIYYEEPDLYISLNIPAKKNNNYNMNIQLEKRPFLKKVFEHLKEVADVSYKYEYSCQVPYINIIGITGFQKKIYKSVNIEVLDVYTCLKNTEQLPTGLMQLKLRMLDRCDEGLITIEASDIADNPNCELKEILMDELTLVC